MAIKSGAMKRSEAAPSSGKPPSKPLAAPRASHATEEAGFDRLIYERVRLGIMSALAMNEHLTFNELKSLFDVSDGNLSAHARKLEEANYLTMKKSFEGRVPRTEYSLTAAGRRALERYLDHMEALIKATRG